MNARIYVASSWRNDHQPDVVQQLKGLEGAEVYDFRAPSPSDSGFHWSDIEPDWQKVSVGRFVEILDHELANDAYANDIQALESANICVLVMPCGRSAHLELGHACGAGKATAVFYPKGVRVEPELMYKMCGLITDDMDRLKLWIADQVTRRR